MHFTKMFVIWTIISLKLLCDGSVNGYSELYTDNGLDQTVRKKNIPRADIERIRNHILDMVELPHRPLHYKHHKSSVK